MTSAPVLLRGLLDDAAIFPPGNLPLAEAVVAHRRHRASPYAVMVGPFVVGAGALRRLADLLEPDEDFEVAVTVPHPRLLGDVLGEADELPGVRVVAVEVALPDDVDPTDVVPLLDAATAGRDLTTYVEVPRDERRDAVVAALAGSGHMAKLRTGGVTPDLYPGVDELASVVADLVRAGVPFKATAGLHHAIRNTARATGVVQHGFVNLICAVDAVQQGGAAADAARLLAERDPVALVAALREVDGRTPHVREMFRSFGTCSIDEPREELAALGWTVEGGEGE